MADKAEYELCTRVEDVRLPKKGVFGISAATGGLAGIGGRIRELILLSSP